MIESSIYLLQDYSTHEKLLSLSPSGKFILYLLKRKGPLSQKDIIKRTLLSKRTVVYSLKKLYEANFIKKLTDNKDKRLRFYEVLI
ncbi:MAG: MarR family transcriptional regulator [Candidatus Lokiarchaeota archaeon]|nr:MarR family transcriptional regulator [Candidatus Lokiarchaeota archaeon]